MIYEICSWTQNLDTSQVPILFLTSQLHSKKETKSIPLQKLEKQKREIGAKKYQLAKVGNVE